jgi:hypothetical protein
MLGAIIIREHRVIPPGRIKVRKGKKTKCKGFQKNSII